MLKIPVEEMTKFFENKYEAVIVLAKEARRVNLYAGEEMEEKSQRPIIQAVKKLLTEGIDFAYETPETPEEKKKRKEEKEKKKE